MARQVLWCFVLVAFLAGGADAELWYAAACGETYRNRWDGSFSDGASFERAVRSASPASPLFVPKPFPTSDEEVVLNLRSWYTRTWEGTKPAQLPEDERLLVETLAAGKASFEVIRVANWSTRRCDAVRPRSFYHLIRVRGAGGQEIARFAFDSAGFFKRYLSFPANADATALEAWRSSLPDLPVAAADIRSRFRLEPRNTQYVHAFTDGNLCDVLAPCVSFRAGGAVYVRTGADPSTLLEFTSASPRESLREREERQLPPLQGEGSPLPGPKRTLSLADVYVIVEEVHPPATSP